MISDEYKGSTDEDEMAAWVEVLARDTVTFYIGYNNDGPTITMKYTETGKGRVWLLDPA